MISLLLLVAAVVVAAQPLSGPPMPPAPDAAKVQKQVARAQVKQMVAMTKGHAIVGAWTSTNVYPMFTPMVRLWGRLPPLRLVCLSNWMDGERRVVSFAACGLVPGRAYLIEASRRMKVWTNYYGWFTWTLNQTGNPTCLRIDLEPERAPNFPPSPGGITAPVIREYQFWRIKEAR